MFTQHFPTFADEGDTITCEVDGFTATAKLYRDDGFWPSLDPTSAGYIGDKTQDDLDEAQRQAEAAMEAWLRAEWFYVGVCVQISKAGVMLTGPYYHTVWGIECNNPNSDNSYLTIVANDLLPEALDAAREVVAKLCGDAP